MYKIILLIFNRPNLIGGRKWKLSKRKIIWKEILWKHNIRSFKNFLLQQTRLYWVCSWEIMEGATSLTPPSPGWAQLCSQIKVLNPIVPKGLDNVKLTSLYRCTGRKDMIIYKQNMAFSNVLCEELKPVPRIQRCDEEVKKIKLIYTRLVK